MTDFDAALAELRETNQDFLRAKEHADLTHLPDLHTLANIAARLESLSIKCARCVALRGGSSEERAKYLRAAAAAAETRANIDELKASLLANEAIAEAKRSTKH